MGDMDRERTNEVLWAALCAATAELNEYLADQNWYGQAECRTPESWITEVLTREGTLDDGDKVYVVKRKEPQGGEQ